MNKEYLIKAQDMLELERVKNKRIESQRRSEVLSRIPEYGRLSAELARTAGEVIEVAMMGGENRAERLNDIKKRNLEIQSQMAELLQKNGYSADYLKPIYSCTLCNDKGAVEGRWCECVKRIVVKLAADELNNGRLCSFEEFDLSLYSDEVVSQYGRSVREIMRDNLNDCKKYVESFSGKDSGIFMMGNTGLGKTHLSLAIAKELIKKGFSVIYNSVPEILRTLSAEQFSKNDGDSMPVVEDCDLLILDDLGAEHSSEYSASMVYQLINSRLSKNKPIIVSTNLDMSEIKARYHDRIWSRLFSMRVLLFYGTDNRIKTAGSNW